MSLSRPLQAEPDANLDPLTVEQQPAVDAWRRGGMIDSPQVAALRKQAGGEPLTEAERTLLATPGRKPPGVGIPPAHVLAEFEERRRRGE
jgi:hypothetical protein